jgi:hypothetical protein
VGEGCDGFYDRVTVQAACFGVDVFHWFKRAGLEDFSREYRSTDFVATVREQQDELPELFFGQWFQRKSGRALGAAASSDRRSRQV